MNFHELETDPQIKFCVTCYLKKIFLPCDVKPGVPIWFGVFPIHLPYFLDRWEIIRNTNWTSFIFTHIPHTPSIHCPYTFISSDIKSSTVPVQYLFSMVSYPVMLNFSGIFCDSLYPRVTQCFHFRGRISKLNHKLGPQNLNIP